MDEKRFLSMLGLCRRAGEIIIGTDLVTKALPSGKVQVVFFTADSSENTKKKPGRKLRHSVIIPSLRHFPHVLIHLGQPSFHTEYRNRKQLRKKR